MGRWTARWDAEAQRWHRGVEPAAYAPPPPPFPEYLPQVTQAPQVTQVAAGQGPAGTGGGRAWRRWPGRKPVASLAAVAVLAAAGVAVWLVLDSDEGKPEAKPGGPASPSTAPGPGTGDSSPSGQVGEDGQPQDGFPSPGAGGESSPPALPPGFDVVEDEEGFTLAVPVSWERTSGTNGVFYKAADGRSLLQIFRITEAHLTPLEAVESASGALGQNTEGYRQLGLGPVPSGPENPAGDAAELHYAYDRGEDLGFRECIERAFTATDGDKYAVLACAPAEESPFQRDVLTTALTHFAP